MSPRDEAELLDQTIKLAQLNRWAVCHFRPAKTRSGWRTAIQGHIGFPDIVLARAGVVLLRELKGPKGRLAPEQADWARQISGEPHWSEQRFTARLSERATALFDVWRPDDWEPLIIPVLTAGQAARRPA